MKPLLKTKTILNRDHFLPVAIILILSFMSGKVNCQVLNSGFENSLTDWTHEGTSIKSISTINNWSVLPAEGYMAEIIPASYDANSAATALLLTSASISWPNVTNFGALYQDIQLIQGQSVTFWWNYVSSDPSYDDGCFASLSGTGWQEVKVLVRSVTDGMHEATGKYGLTGWHTVTFVAPSEGTYRLGFGVFNSIDQRNNPHLFIDNEEGATFAPGYPVVTTSPLSNPTETSITAGGAVLKAGYGSVTDKGIVYATSPDLALNEPGVTKVSGGIGLGSYTCNLTGLMQGVTYYVRAYATNSINYTAYGGTVSFTTPSSGLPSVTTQDISDITHSSATTGGSIPIGGGSEISAKGIVWNSSGNPTVNSNLGITNHGTGSSPFTDTITGLTSNTAYYVKAYAINSSDTVYGLQITFRTATDPPITTAATNIGQSSFTANWNSTAEALNYYLDVSTDESFSQMLTDYKNKDMGTGTSALITGLIPGTNYFYRISAFNGDVTSIHSNTTSLKTLELHHFHIETTEGASIGSQIAGDPFLIKIFAMDATNQLIPDYGGSVSLTSTGNLIQGSETDSFVNGVLNAHQVVLTRAGNDIILTASSGEITGTSNAFIVNPASLHNFLVESDSSSDPHPDGIIVYAGERFGVKVSARDQYNNIKRDYAGNILFNSSKNDIVQFPAGLQQFTAGEGASFNNGIRIFEDAITIPVAGSYWLSVADATQSSICDTLQNILVEPSAHTISYRMSNPRIYDSNSFEFDIEVKSTEEVYLAQGLVSFNFNELTFNNNYLLWDNVKGPALEGDLPNLEEPKYAWSNSNPTIAGNNAVIGFDANDSMVNASDEYLNKINSTWQRIMTIRALLISGQPVDLTWDHSKMANQQYYQAGSDAILFSNLVLEDVSFSDLYPERFYTLAYGWQEIGGNGAPDFSVPKLTSILNGILTAGANWTATALRLHPDATLTLTPGSAITVGGELDIQASEGLIIQSDASGTGSLIASSVTGVGSAKVQRYMTGNTWHLIASPVSGQSVTGFLTSNTLIPEKEGARGFTTYNTVDNAWNPMFNPDEPGNLTSGAGFLARTSIDGTVGFTGQIASGYLIIPVSDGGSGWNLVGNPYTSALLTNDLSNGFLQQNDQILDPSYVALYVWDESYSTSGYRVINYLTDPDVASLGQGFLIKVRESGSIGFNPSMQVHQPEAQQKSATTERPSIKLTLNQSGSQASTEIIFSSQATNGLDPGFDAGLLQPDLNISLYTRLVDDNGNDFAIQALPLPNASPIAIPLGLTSMPGGEVLLSAVLNHIPSHIKAELHDRQSNTIYPFHSEKTSVSLQLNSSSSFSDRFYLVLNNQTTETSPDALEPIFRVYRGQEEIVLEGQFSSLAIVRITDLQGRVISECRPGSGNSHHISTRKLTTGIYLFQIRDHDRFKSFKIPVLNR